MAEENQNINPEEESSKQEQENQDLNQEDLAKQWEESLQQQEKKQEGSSDENQEDLAKQWEEALQQQNEESNDNQEDIAKQWEESLQQEEGKPTEKENIQGINIPGIDNEKLEMLLDIPLEISVEVGNKTLTLEDILKLNSNAIVELDRYINEPVDIKINGKLIAKGELYTVENNFGIKITNIVTVQERLKFLMENGGE